MPTRPLRWPDPPLGDSTLTLRPWRLDDAEVLAQAWHDPLIMAMGSVPAVRTEAYAKNWIASVDQRLSAGVAIDLVIVDDDDDVLGEVGATFAPGASDQAEIGYWIRPEHRRRGVAGAALCLFADWLLSPHGLGLRRLGAQVDPANAASVRVLERADFVQAGTGEGGRAIYLRPGTENLRP